MTCAVMLCGGVGWRWFGTCITVVIQSVREEVRQEKREKNGERGRVTEREDKRGERKDRRGSDVLLKLGQLHFLSLVLTRSSVIGC